MTISGTGSQKFMEPRFAWFSRNKNKPTPALVSVASVPQGVDVKVDEADLHSQKGGQAPFTRTYAPRQGITLRAPHSFTRNGDRYVLDGWYINDVRAGSGGVLTIDDLRGKDHSANVVYYALGHMKPYGAGCRGSSGIVVQQAEGRPVAGLRVKHILSSGPNSSVAALQLGLSRTAWNGLSLPIDMTTAGAAGCSIYASQALLAIMPTTRFGTASLEISIPNDKGIAGLRYFTQFFCLDAAANLLGMTYSNGFEVLIGNR